MTSWIQHGRIKGMKRASYKAGFSLTEVLIAIGVLAVGMVFVAGVFPVAIHFTTVATERTVAAVVADTAFANIQLYRIDPTGLLDDRQIPVQDVADIPAIMFLYPSTYHWEEIGGSWVRVMTGQPGYYWWALCRRTSSGVQVTVFVCRKAGPELGTLQIVGVTPISQYELQLSSEQKQLVNDGYWIVDDKTGEIYRVLSRFPNKDTNVLLGKSNPWEDAGPGFVWTIAPPQGGGRYPCIAVFQKVIR